MYRHCHGWSDILDILIAYLIELDGAYDHVCCFVREGRPQRHEDEETDMVQMVQVTNVEMDYLKQRHMPEPLLQRFD